MYALEPRANHIAANREQVVGIHQSLNQPHVAVPGKQAQAAQAYVVGTHNPDNSYTAWVYLHLAETDEGVVFLSENRKVAAQQFRAEEAEALAFLESMGFMADSLSFRERSPEDQEELLRTLPCFRPLTGKKKEQGPTRAESLARLLASF